MLVTGGGSIAFTMQSLWFLVELRKQANFNPVPDDSRVVFLLGAFSEKPFSLQFIHYHQKRASISFALVELRKQANCNLVVRYLMTVGSFSFWKTQVWLPMVILYPETSSFMYVVWLLPSSETRRPPSVNLQKRHYCISGFCSSVDGK